MDSQSVLVAKFCYAGLVKDTVAVGCVRDARGIRNAYKFYRKTWKEQKIWKA